MLEAPLLKSIFEIDELLGQFIELKMLIGITVDAEPRIENGLIGFISLAEVTVQCAVING